MEVVAPGSGKEWDLSVVVPVEDMSTLGQPTGELEGSAAGAQPRTSIWPAVEERVLENSYHVATLDNDAPTIFDGSLAFVRAHAPAAA